MTFDNKQLYQQARLSRDPRFDGKFFIAVKSTGIFCRTICPAKLPLEKNIVYFTTKEEAINAGFRPCYRCKPEFSPCYHEISHRSELVKQAIELINSGSMLTASVEQIAAAIFTSTRNLNKAFNIYYGIPLKQYQDISKALFAKKLLFCSSLTIPEISEACGYSSPSGLYSLVKKYLKVPIRKLQNTKREISAEKLILKIPFVTTYNWSFFLKYQSQRLIDKIETIIDDTYKRTITILDVSGEVEITPTEKELIVELSGVFLPVLPIAIKKIMKVFDMETNTFLVESKLKTLYPLLNIQAGLRIPGTFSPYEAGIRAICGQQISVSAATNLLNQFVNIFSKKDPLGRYYFPTPENVTREGLTQLKAMASKKNTLFLFSQWCTEHNIDLEINHLINVKGIGKWTIDYIKLRGMNEPDIWIDTDLGIKKAIEKYALVDTKTASPWRSYLSIHSWNNL